MHSILPTDRVFVLTGAGVSAESGIPTFRGVGGLWQGYRIEEVATPSAWTRDPRLVWQFHSMRRRIAHDERLNHDADISVWIEPISVGIERGERNVSLINISRELRRR
jgi:NAD-dependent SIR2 family protein deacetylase